MIVTATWIFMHTVPPSAACPIVVRGRQLTVAREVTNFERSRLLVRITAEVIVSGGLTKANTQEISDLLALVGSSLGNEPVPLKDILSGIATFQIGVARRDFIDTSDDAEATRLSGAKFLGFCDSVIILFFAHEDAIWRSVKGSSPFTAQVQRSMFDAFGGKVEVLGGVVKYPNGSERPGYGASTLSYKSYFTAQAFAQNQAAIERLFDSERGY